MLKEKKKRSVLPLLLERELWIHFLSDGTQCRAAEVERQVLPRFAQRRIGIQVQVEGRTRGGT